MATRIFSHRAIERLFYYPENSKQTLGFGHQSLQTEPDRAILPVGTLRCKIQLAMQWYDIPVLGPTYEPPGHGMRGFSGAITTPFLVIDDFLPTEMAQTMRGDIERHFGSPNDHQPDTHQIWNYWFVPSLYAYLRTQPEKVIDRTLVERFVTVIQRWSSDTLGLGKVTWPYLSLYVSGCQQNLHNDSVNGRFGFVYSLTSTHRQTIGGATVILHEGDLFRRSLRKPMAATAFVELLEPRFNRLVVFDDRLVHGVERVDGSMNPVDGRCVLHGHIEESGPIIDGALQLETVADGIRAAVGRLITDASAGIQVYHGPFSVRLTISPSGKVKDCRILLDRVVREAEGDVEWKILRDRLIESLNCQLFPPAPDETRIILPVTFGGPLRATKK